MKWGQIYNSIVQATGVGIGSVGAPVPRLHHNACYMNDLGSHVSPADSVGLNRVLQRLFHLLLLFLILSKKKFLVVGGFELETLGLANEQALNLLSKHKSENPRKLRTSRYFATYIAVTIHLKHMPHWKGPGFATSLECYIWPLESS